MLENYYGLVEMVFSFGVVIIFGIWQLRSIEKTRKRLREEQLRQQQSGKDDRS